MNGKKKKDTGNTKCDVIINRDFSLWGWRVLNWIDVKWLYK